MKPVSSMSQLELGAFVHSHLQERGIATVLSGGAAVSVYAGNQYVSKDLDLINVNAVHRKELMAAMAELGFVEQHRYFKHPESEHIVEFPPGPLSIGDEPVKGIEVRTFPTGSIRVISPTDCVKDRLAAYFHFGDQQGLQQAILVAQSIKVDLQDVKRWSEGEGKLTQWKNFEAALAARPRPGPKGR